MSFSKISLSHELHWSSCVELLQSVIERASSTRQRQIRRDRFHRGSDSRLRWIRNWGQLGMLDHSPSRSSFAHQLSRPDWPVPRSCYSCSLQNEVIGRYEQKRSSGLVTCASLAGQLFVSLACMAKTVQRILNSPSSVEMDFDLHR